MAEWTEKRIPEFAMTEGIVADYEKEIQPLRNLVREFLGKEADVKMSWRKESVSGIVYYCPEACVTIHGIVVCMGTLLGCAQLLLEILDTLLEGRHSNAEQ